MGRIIAAVGASLVAGFALGAWLSGDADVPPANGSPAVTAAPDPASANDLEGRLAELERVINSERQARLVLEDLIAGLIEDLERLEGTDARRVADEQARAAELRDRERRRVDGEWQKQYRERRVGQLVDGGFSEVEARRVLQLESEAQFKAMEALWEQQRDGEPFGRLTPDVDPQSILRSELGDEAYAGYLEAMGQPTAIRVRNVMDGSPGNQAGLRPGDQLVRYDGARVFNVNDLRYQTMQGNRGEDVVVEIERDGMSMQLTVPRGPIGITGSGANIRGMPWWGG